MARPKLTSDKTISARAAPAREAEVATYIADMARELTRMAQDARLDLLAHFLSLAQLEAEMAARRGSDAEPR